MCVKVISATHFLHPKCRDERARFGEFISHSEEKKVSFSHITEEIWWREFRHLLF